MTRSRGGTATGAVAAAYAAQGFGYATVLTSLPALRTRVDIDAFTVSMLLLGTCVAAAIGSFWLLLAGVVCYGVGLGAVDAAANMQGALAYGAYLAAVLCTRIATDIAVRRFGRVRVAVAAVAVAAIGGCLVAFVSDTGAAIAGFALLGVAGAVALGIVASGPALAAAFLIPTAVLILMLPLVCALRRPVIAT